MPGVDCSVFCVCVSAELGWKDPTLIQEWITPDLALDGKDIVARARTGSGKTAVLLIPIIQQIPAIESAVNQEACTRALVIVSSKELSKQAYKNLLVSLFVNLP